MPVQKGATAKDYPGMHRMDPKEKDRRWAMIQEFGVMEAARRLGVHPRALSALKKRRLRDDVVGSAIEPTPLPAAVDAPGEARIRRAEERAKRAEERARRAEDDVERLREALEMQTSIPRSTPGGKVRITRRAARSHGHTAVLQLSDLHNGSLVKPEWVDYVNAFDPDVCRRRVEHVTSNVVEVLREHRRYVLDEFVTILGGDLVQGELRSDDARTNAVDPPVQVALVREDCARALRTFRSELNAPLRVVCTDDNHGRIDEKLQSKGQVDRNLSIMACRLIRDDLCREGVTTPDQWLIPQSGEARFPIYRWHVAAAHGHNCGVRFAGSTSGIAHTIARAGFNMASAYAREGRPIDWSYIGHWHSPEHLTQARITANGSIVGVDPYARKLKLPFHPPVQMLTIWHPVRGLVEAIQIWAEPPGWKPGA